MQFCLGPITRLSKATNNKQGETKLQNGWKVKPILPSYKFIDKIYLLGQQTGIKRFRIIK